MSVYKPRNSPYYHYDFQRRGVRFHGSTGCTSRREAETAERLIKQRVAADESARRSSDPASIDLVWARFWTEKGQHDSGADTTFDRMEVLQDGLRDILKERGRPLIASEIDSDIISAYVARRRGTIGRNKKLLSNASVNREIQILRRIMRRAALVWKLSIHLPMWSDLILPESDERVVDLSHGAEEIILSHMRPDFRPAARWLIMSGLRISNALPLTPSCVDFQSRLISVRQKSRKPGGRLHILPITQPMMVLLANEIGHMEDAVFTYVARRTCKGRVRGQRYPLLPDTFYNEFKAAARKAGLPDLHPHDLRHVAGTRTLRASGGNLRAAQRHLGHSRISTTTKYAHYLVDELREAMEAAHAPAAPLPEAPVEKKNSA